MAESAASSSGSSGLWVAAGLPAPPENSQVSFALSASGGTGALLCLWWYFNGQLLWVHRALSLIGWDILTAAVHTKHMPERHLWSLCLFPDLPSLLQKKSLIWIHDPDSNTYETSSNCQMLTYFRSNSTQRTIGQVKSNSPWQKKNEYWPCWLLQWFINTC